MKRLLGLMRKKAMAGSPKEALIRALRFEYKELIEQFDKIPHREQPWSRFEKYRSGARFDYSSTAFLSISLLASDEQIVEEVRRELSNLRKVEERTLEKKVTRQDLDKWIKFGVLPYLDLRIWQELNDVEIKQSLIANLIFPNLFDVAPQDRLRKTTIKLAEQVISPANLKRLRMQASEEKRKK